MNRWLLTRRTRPAPGATPTRLTLNTLEERVVPTVVTVSDNNDTGGANTLRAAIATVNASTDPTNTIKFLDGMTGAVTLTSDLTLITKPVDIVGNGVTLSKIDGNDKFDIFRFDHGTGAVFAASVTGLTLTRGRDHDKGGAAIYSKAESLTVKDCVIDSNSCLLSSGGAIRADGGTFTITNTKVTNNKVTYVKGGGIFNSGAAFTISGCTIDGNKAGSSGGGYSQTGLPH